MIERAKERFPLIPPLLIPLGFYLVILVVSHNWIQANPESTWRYPVALAPMIPGVFIALGVLRAIRKLDEMAQKILVEAAAISFTLTLVLNLSLGLLGLAGFPQPNGIYVGTFMLVMWLVGKLLVTSKYQ